jgi:hypothetical protein
MRKDKKQNPGFVDVGARLADTRRVTEAVREAGRQARLKHKQMGVPLVVWQDGKIVHIPPEEIVVDPPPPKGD